MRRFFATAVLVAALTHGASAQEPAATDAPAAGTAPIEISADNGLVWDRTAHTYTARGHAQARQGSMTVTSDELVARYDAAGSGSDIREVTAVGNVVLASPPYTAYGDKAVYDLAGGLAVLTGGDLRAMTPGETLTAGERLTYAASDGRMTAEGGAVLTRPTDSLSARTLTATFATLANGTRGLDVVTADGNVVIKTVRETVTGSKGVYRAASQTAELTGDVVITQGKNRLEGNRATVDMKSGVSQLYGSPAAGGRVKGVFYPQDKTGAAPAAARPVPASALPATSSIAAETPAVAQVPVSALSDAVSSPPAVTPPEPSPSSPPAQVKPTVVAPVADAEKNDAPASSPLPPEDLPPEPFAVPAAQPDHTSRITPNE